MTKPKNSKSGVKRPPRTNMFVMATVHADTGSAPVKIRDLSSSGALIEGGVLPHPGTKIRLVRGDLTIRGQVVWSEGTRAGLEFDAQAIVAAWMPNGRPPLPQARSGESVNEFKTATLNVPSGFIEPSPGRVSAEELQRVKAMLEALAVVLGNDIGVIERHGFELRALELAAQLLGKIAVEIE